MIPPSSFGLWIRQRRRALDLTQESLADKVGCSLSAIRKIESDERRPSRQVAELLAEALEVQPGERPTFLRIARMELRVDELASISPPPSLPVGLSVSPAPTLAPAPLPPPAAAAVPPAPRPVLPAPPTALVGREVELVQISSTLLHDECRLLTLVGPGGIGKSRLALAVAERMIPHFADGVWFAPLSSVQTAEQLAFAVAGALEIGQYGHADPLRQLMVFLRDKCLLLILDSMEHLLDGGDMLISEILRSAPNVKVLATSREQVNLQGEWLFSVRGLSVPDGEVIPAWEHSSAMRLFVQSARRANVAFTPGPAELSAIAHICRLVEGLPLAIELAASWVRVLTCQEIAAETERDWGFLSGATRDMPARHRSLRAVFEQSWALLSSGERRILGELSVFRRGFRREAAEKVAGASLLDLSSLTAKSLLYPVSGDRFEVQELVRQYAAEQLATRGDERATRERHAGWFLKLGEQTEPLLHRERQLEYFDRLEADHDNLRAALRWLADHDVQGGLRLSAALWWFWFVRGYWREGRSWLAEMIERSQGTSTPERAATMARAANLAWLNGDTERSVELLTLAENAAEQSGDARSLILVAYVRGQVETHHNADLSSLSFVEAQERARAVGDRWAEARATYRLGINAFVDDNVALARKQYEESLAIFRSLGDLWGIYATLSDLGGLSRREGDLTTALRVGQECLLMCRSLGFRQGTALELLQLGVVSWGLGDFAAAQSYLGESRRAFAEIDNRRGVADAHFHLGNTARFQGDLAEAVVQYEFALAISRDMGFAPSIATALHGLAEVARLQGDLTTARALLRETLTEEQVSPGLRFYLTSVLESAGHIAAAEARPDEAVRMVGAAAALRTLYTAARPPVEQAEYERLVSAVRARFAPQQFDALWQEGATLDPAAAGEMAALFLA